MGQMLLLNRRARADRHATFRGAGRPSQDPAGAARGILLALALSAVAWIALALLVPRLW